MNKGKIIVFFIIGLVILGLLIVGIFTSQQKNEDNNQQSLDRMTKLKRSLTTSFGQYWAINIIMYIVLILVILGLLFFYTRSDKYNITISDHNGRMIYWTGITIAILFGIFIVGMAVTTFVNGDTNTYPDNSIPGYQADEDREDRKKIVLIIGSILAVITIILSILLYFRKNKKK